MEKIKIRQSLALIIIVKEQKEKSYGNRVFSKIVYIPHFLQPKSWLNKERL